MKTVVQIFFCLIRFVTAVRVALNHCKQARVFSNNCQQSVINVATMMLDTAKNKRDEAMKYLEEIGEKRKLFTEKQHKQLDKAMLSRTNTAHNKSEQSSC